MLIVLGIMLTDTVYGDSSQVRPAQEAARHNRAPQRILPGSILPPPSSFTLYRFHDLTKDWASGCEYSFIVKIDRREDYRPKPDFLEVYLVIGDQDEILMEAAGGDLLAGKEATFTLGHPILGGIELRNAPARGEVSYSYRIYSYTASHSECEYTVPGRNGEPHVIHAPCPGTRKLLATSGTSTHRVLGVDSAPYLGMSAGDNFSGGVTQCWWGSSSCECGIATERDSTGTITGYMCINPGAGWKQNVSVNIKSFAPPGAKVHVDSATVTSPSQNNGAVTLTDASSIPATLDSAGQKISLSLNVDFEKVWDLPLSRWFGIVSISGQCVEHGAGAPFNLLIALGDPEGRPGA